MENNNSCQPEPVVYAIHNYYADLPPIVPDPPKPRVPVSPYAKFDRMRKKNCKR